MDGLPDAVRFVALGAQEIADRDVCFVGIGVPSLAAIAAKRRHAPRAVLIYESGAIDADPPVPPLSTGSPSVVANTAMVTSCLGVFSMLQRGRFDLGLLSAAQVDRFGNLNSTELARADRSPVRLVGSGGANDIAVLARATVILMPHDRRRFVERVDFATSPGFKGQPGAHAAMAARGGGPRALVTPRARFTFEAGELTLEALAHGVDEADAVDIVPWPVRRARAVRRLPPVDDALAKTAQDLLGAWGRDAA
jgi:glutaconate CoA-transferase, subunit B